MDPINLSVEVHCKIPGWVSEPHNSSYRNNIYRLYINGDLYTERSWLWDYNHTYILEDIWSQLGKNIQYKLELVPIMKNAAQAKFRLEKFRASSLYECQLVHDRLITFTIK